VTSHDCDETLPPPLGNFLRTPLPAGMCHKQHGDHRERKKFDAHAELRRLLRHQTVKRF